MGTWESYKTVRDVLFFYFNPVQGSFKHMNKHNHIATASVLRKKEDEEMYEQFLGVYRKVLDLQYITGFDPMEIVASVIIVETKQETCVIASV